jgi:hypothetical protein
MRLPQLSEEEIQGLIAQATEFANGQYERFVSRAQPLTEPQRTAVDGFFSDDVLRDARVILLENESVLNPDFVTELRARGFEFLFDINHLNAVPFREVLVYHETINKRLLFHGLVHLVQQRVMGQQKWLERYVRSLLKTGLHVSIPIEVHAYELDGRYALSPATLFSVEEEVRAWADAGRY